MSQEPKPRDKIRRRRLRGGDDGDHIAVEIERGHVNNRFAAILRLHYRVSLLVASKCPNSNSAVWLNRFGSDYEALLLIERHIL